MHPNKEENSLTETKEQLLIRRLFQMWKNYESKGSCGLMQKLFKNLSSSLKSKSVYSLTITRRTP